MHSFGGRGPLRAFPAAECFASYRAVLHSSGREGRHCAHFHTKIGTCGGLFCIRLEGERHCAHFHVPPTIDLTPPHSYPQLRGVTYAYISLIRRKPSPRGPWAAAHQVHLNNIKFPLPSWGFPRAYPEPPRSFPGRPGASREIPREPNTAQDWLQDGPKLASGRPKRLPRLLQDGPHDGPKRDP